MIFTWRGRQAPKVSMLPRPPRGKGSCPKATWTPREKHDMTSKPTLKTEIVSGQLRGRPYSA